MSETKETVSTPPEVRLAVPGWVTAAVVVVIAYFGWQMERGLNKLEDLNARVAVLEERIPQPLSKELQPLFEQMKKVEIQLAELRGAGTVKDAARIPNESE